MQIRKLEKEEIVKIYQEQMRVDFPKSELKPLNRILNLYDQELYIVYGLIIEERILGYAFLVMTQKRDWVLLDYFAIHSQNRGIGLGSSFLTMVMSELKKAKTKAILIEIEHIEGANSKEEERIRIKRRTFYLENGIREVSACATIYGNEYEILYQSFIKEFSKEVIMAEYKKIYRTMLSYENYNEHCFISE